MQIRVEPRPVDRERCAHCGDVIGAEASPTEPELRCSACQAPYHLLCYEAAPRACCASAARGSAEGIQVQLRRSPDERCGFCLDTFEADEQPAACPECSSPYHPDCYEDELSGHCATIACPNAAPPQGLRRLRFLRTRLRRRRRSRLLHPEKRPALQRWVFYALAAGLAFGALCFVALLTDRSALGWWQAALLLGVAFVLAQAARD